MTKLSAPPPAARRLGCLGTSLPACLQRICLLTAAGPIAPRVAPRAADEEAGYRQEEDDQGRTWDDIMSDDGEGDEEADADDDESGAGAAKEAAEGKTGGGADDDDENDPTVMAARRKVKAMKQGVRMAAAVKRQMDVLRGLAPGDFALIDCGWVSKAGGHAIMMAIERLADDAGAPDAAAASAAGAPAAATAGVAAAEDGAAQAAAALPADLGTFTVTLCNTGAGVDHHPSSQHDYPKTKYRTALHLGRVPGWKLVDEYFIFNVVRCSARTSSSSEAACNCVVAAVAMIGVDVGGEASSTLRGCLGDSRVLPPSANEAPHGRSFHYVSSTSAVFSLFSSPLCPLAGAPHDAAR